MNRKEVERAKLALLVFLILAALAAFAAVAGAWIGGAAGMFVSPGITLTVELIYILYVFLVVARGRDEIQWGRSDTLILLVPAAGSAVGAGFGIAFGSFSTAAFVAGLVTYAVLVSKLFDSISPER